MTQDPSNRSSKGPIRSAEWAVMGLSVKLRSIRTPAFALSAPLAKSVPLQTSCNVVGQNTQTHGSRCLIVGPFGHKRIAHRKAAIREDVNGEPFSGRPTVIGFFENRRGCLPEILTVPPDDFILGNLVY